MRVVTVFIRPEHQIHPPSCLQSKISLVRSTKESTNGPRGCLRGGANQPDKQLAVEHEEKFVPKNATAAVVHLQDWGLPKKKLLSTVKTLLCVNFRVVM